MTTLASFPSENPQNTRASRKKIVFKSPSICILCAYLTHVPSVFCKGNEPRVLVTFLYQHYTSSTGVLASNRDWEELTENNHTHLSETRVCSHLEHYWSAKNTAATQPAISCQKDYLSLLLTGYVMPLLYSISLTVQNINFFLHNSKSTFSQWLQCHKQRNNYMSTENNFTDVPLGANCLLLSKWSHKQRASSFGIEQLLETNLVHFQYLASHSKPVNAACYHH